MCVPAVLLPVWSTGCIHAHIDPAACAGAFQQLLRHPPAVCYFSRPASLRIGAFPGSRSNVLCKSPQTLPNSPRAVHRSIFANFSHHTRVWSSRTLTIRSYSERMASVCSSSPSYCIYSESFRAVKNTPSEHTPPRSIRPLTIRLRAYAPGPYAHAPGSFPHLGFSVESGISHSVPTLSSYGR